MRPAHNFIDLTGQRFGLVQVLGIAAERGSHDEVKWRCLCACGNETTAIGYRLRSGHTNSCGCLRSASGAASRNSDNRPVLDRLAERSHVAMATRCTIWNGTRNYFGHGLISIFGINRLVHRVAWEAEKGLIPQGLDCLHDCPGGDNPACWNVGHLWLGTQADNNADRDCKGRHVALKGQDHGCAKLTNEQVRAIRCDPRRNVAIAGDFDISFSQVGRIKSGKAWAHVQ